MSNQVLTVSQMRHLESLNLDISDASMYYRFFQDTDESYTLCIKEYPVDVKPDKERCLPAYTLQDIMGRLPNIIKDGNYEFCLGMVINVHGKKSLRYTYINDSFDQCIIISYNEEECGNLLNAAYNLLCWIIENKYI